MTYEIFWSGAGAVVLGALIAAWLTYRFQAKLLHQQLEFQERLHKELLAFQKEQAELDAATRERIQEEQLAAIDAAARHVKTGLGSVARNIANPQPD
jgi:hypothetical protein